MYDYDYIQDNMTSVAQSCKFLNTSSSMKAGNRTAESISCNICNNWNGSRCIKKAFEQVTRKLELD